MEHIHNVQRNCLKLGFKLIKIGEIHLGRTLISNSLVHDVSKLSGIEFDHLWRGDDLLFDVVKHHSSTNEHHPEYWHGIQNMPAVYIAEMVCDCAARSSEFGSDLRKWFDEAATKKYNFSMDDEVGQRIKRFLDLLLAPPF